MNKKMMYLLSYILILILIFFGGSIAAFLSDSGEKDKDFEIGIVDVDITIYFEKMNEYGELIIYTENIDYVGEVGDGDSFTKFGVAKINLSNVNDVQFIKNFRVSINIHSSVETYFRIAPFEQLTITYTVGGETREVATTQKNFMDFNYDPSNKFYNNRLFDGFYYYKDKVVRVSENTPHEIEFIGKFKETANFDLHDEKYTLQIGFIVDAVQAHEGPQILWGMPNTPWEEEW